MGFRMMQYSYFGGKLLVLVGGKFLGETKLDTWFIVEYGFRLERLNKTLRWCDYNF